MTKRGSQREPASGEGRELAGGDGRFRPRHRHAGQEVPRLPAPQSPGWRSRALSLGQNSCEAWTGVEAVPWGGAGSVGWVRDSGRLWPRGWGACAQS